MGFIISQKIIYGAIDENPEFAEDYPDSIKKIDLGFSLGAGLNISISEILSLDLDVKNHLGLLNISRVKLIDGGSIKM